MPESLQPSEIRAILVKYAAFCLNRRPYFRETLRQKLVLRSQKLKIEKNTSVIDAILDDLQNSGYLDDAYLAEAFVRRQLGKGYGPRMITSKLNRYHLDSDTVSAALENEANPAQQIASIRKYISKFQHTDQRKTVYRLYSRGFTYSVINKVFDAEYLED